MPDDQQPGPEPIRFTQYVAQVVDVWPPVTSFTPEWLEYAHVHKATVRGNTVTIAADNGTAVYRLDRSQQHAGGFLAFLVEGDTPGRLKQRAAKYRPSEDAAEEGASP